MENKINEILKNLNIEIKEVEKPISGAYDNYIENKIPSIVYNIHSENNYAFVPNQFNNVELLNSYNIIPQYMNYNSDNGIIITSDGDLKLVIILPDYLNISINYFIEKIKLFLLKYFINVDVHNNDIMINKKKIIGSGINNINNMNIYMFQITFTDRVELIKKICTKSTKDVGFIDSSILPQETLLNEIISWFK